MGAADHRKEEVVKGYSVLGATLLAIVLAACAGAATTIGIGVGYEPTGLVLFTALTELPLIEFVDVRAQVGFASQGIAGLMIASGSLIVHYPVPPIDPFLGIGVGAALTPPPFASGLLVEGTAGLRAVVFDPLCLFGQVRFLVRWTDEGMTAGPVYEAGIQVRF